jgi:hypothetical protein
MRPLTLSILACCLLTGCLSGTLPTLVERVQVPPPPNLTAPPLPLPPAASGQVPDLEANHRQVALQYHQLAQQLCLLLAYLQPMPPDCTPWTKNTLNKPKP